MNKFFIFPDPDEQSNNDPVFLLHSKQIVRLYATFHKKRYEEILIDDSVREWLKAKALESGWKQCIFVANQALLIATDAKLL